RLTPRLSRRRSRRASTAAVASPEHRWRRLNRKNVEALPEDETVEGGPEDAWVPDQETGVFVPADKATVSGIENHDHCGAAAAAASGSPSVLD
uniref:Uncharacterized protein n=1 Tax=Oryza glaberrima TaxID=4538 RepID=I1PDN4_ORYGL